MWLLGRLSRRPGTGEYPHSLDYLSVETGLARLRRVYPQLNRLVAGRRVLDFGCGEGYQAVALAEQLGCEVLGVDSNPATLERALARAHGVDGPQVRFAREIPPEHRGRFDVVLSQNSMEHYGDPAEALAAMVSALRPGGRLLITFGPPWYAPYGAHHRFYCLVPWINLLFSERTAMAVRARYRTDGATHYADVESGLNQMSVARFERLVRAAGLEEEYRLYRCVWGLHALQHVPILRELFVNQVSVVLRKA